MNQEQQTAAERIQISLSSAIKLINEDCYRSAKVELMQLKEKVQNWLSAPKEEQEPNEIPKKMQEVLLNAEQIPFDRERELLTQIEKLREQNLLLLEKLDNSKSDKSQTAKEEQPKTEEISLGDFQRHLLSAYAKLNNTEERTVFSLTGFESFVIYQYYRYMQSKP